MTPTYFFLGFAYAHKSRFKEAVEEFEAARVTTERNAGAVAGLSYSYALAGRKDETVRLLRELEEGYKQPFVRFPTRVPAYRVAAIYMALGDKERALERLQKDGAAGWFDSKWILSLMDCIPIRASKTCCAACTFHRKEEGVSLHK